MLMNESLSISLVNEHQRPLASLIVFWWGLLLVMQQSHRLVLLQDTLAIDPTGPSTLAMTLLTGFRGDLAMASLGILLGALVALVGWTLMRLLYLVLYIRPSAGLYARCLSMIAGLFAVFFIVFLLIDMGYYAYNKQHPDLVFFEYLEDLFSPALNRRLRRAYEPEPGTDADGSGIERSGKVGTSGGGVRVAASCSASGMGMVFRRAISPGLRVESGCMVHAWSPYLCGRLFGFSGFHPMGPWAIARANISDSSYYLLAQNPLWYTGDVLYGAFSTRLGGATARASRMMDLQEAIDVTRGIVEPGGEFLSAEYPLFAMGGAGRRHSESASECPAVLH